MVLGMLNPPFSIPIFCFQFYTFLVYRRSKFLEALIEIRQEMAREADYDVDLFVEMARSGRHAVIKTHSIIDAIEDTDQWPKPDRKLKRS